MQKTIPAQSLRAQVATVLIATGTSRQEAETVASNLVMANLSGHDSHGVGLLPRYVDAVLEGGLIPGNAAKATVDAGSLMNVDGQRGFGQVVGEQAMRLAIERAKGIGSCIMALSNAHHLGRIGHFAEMAVAEGLVSLHFVNVLARQVVAPYGGADGRYGTNPCCIGIPLQGRAPFILDFATSRVAQGKMRVAHNQGKQVEPGLLLDEHGQPTTDPRVVVAPAIPGMFGSLIAFGEHKGYGMAVACELLGGALTGGGTAHAPIDPLRRAVYNGMLSILIDPVKLGTQAVFEQEALAFVDWLRAGPVAPGFETVQMAGEPERAARLQREQDGISIDAQTWQEMVAAAEKVGVVLAG
jgi:hydroxycarboxylate dehydrogenase B